MVRTGFFLLIFIGISTAVAVDIPLEFEEPEKQQQYQSLLEELRCLVCQNQSLADSHADLAQDLRSQVFNMVSEGQSDQAIIEFLVARYGEFVLYRPRLGASTVLLWFGPFLLLIIALSLVYKHVRRVKVTDVSVGDAEHSRAVELLNDNEDSNRGP